VWTKAPNDRNKRTIISKKVNAVVVVRNVTIDNFAPIPQIVVEASTLASFLVELSAVQTGLIDTGLV
jgi:hypothetical protein